MPTSTQLRGAVGRARDQVAGGDPLDVHARATRRWLIRGYYAPSKAPQTHKKGQPAHEAHVIGDFALDVALAALEARPEIGRIRVDPA